MIDDLWGAIKTGRGAQLDWVSENAPLDSIAAILTAMANARGGTLVIGVLGPNGTLVGVRDSDNAVDRVLQAALSIEPQLIIPLPRPTQLRDRIVVIVHVPAGLPHVYALDGRYLFRHGTENLALRPRELRRLMIERGEVSFETEIAPDTTLDDLDWDKVKAYAQMMGASSSGSHAITHETLLLKRGCLTREVDGGKLHPTYAGILLFGKDPQAVIRGATITAVRFAGSTMGDKFTRVDLNGTLPDQIRKAETFLIDTLRKGVHLGKSMERAEQFEYPLEAARELIVNAVAHRDYSIAGDEIRLFIFGDHMEVTSPGKLPGPVTINNIKDERFSRNPVIVQVLSDMRFIERLGYGVDRVYDLMHAQQLQPPRFEETSGGFRVTLYNHPEPVVITPPTPIPINANTLQYTGVFNDVIVNPRQEVALTYLTNGNHRITNSDLQSMCPDVHAETIRRDLADLVTKKLLKKIGEKRGSYYILNPHAAKPKA